MRAAVRRLSRPLRDLSIKNKLFVSFLLILFVSSGLFILVNAYMTARDKEQQARYSLEALLEQSGSFLNYKTSSIRKVVDIMVIHDTIQAIVAKKADVYRENIGNWLLDEYVFNQLIYNVQTNPDIQNISLYMKGGMASIQSTDQFLRLEDVQGEEWLARLIDEDKPYLWISSAAISPDDENTVSFVRKVPSPLDNHEIAGLLVARMPRRHLEQILDQALFTESTSALLVNGRGERIASSSGSPAADPDEVARALEELEQTDDPLASGGPKGRSDSFRTVVLNGEKAWVGTVPVEHTDWRFILVVPRKDIVEIAQKSQNQMIVIFLIVAALMFPLAFWVSSSGTVRIRRLTKSMRKVGVDPARARLDPQNNDEVGELIGAFNRMISRIDDLAAEKYKLGLEVKNMELRALQAQINPHFLYNTLDMANWLAMKYNAQDIRTLITSLSDFYKLSLSNGEDFIPIRDEIAHVEAYVRIQNMRFRDKIRLEIDVPEDLMGHHTLKLLLQPLVENAILHGIMEKETQTGTVRIVGRASGDAISLSVRDDGVGMDGETLKGIDDGTPRKKTGGYGIRNIHNRLELIFGYPYGLTVESSVGEGTTAMIRFPIVEAKAAERSGG